MPKSKSKVAPTSRGAGRSSSSRQRGGGQTRSEPEAMSEDAIGRFPSRRANLAAPDEGYSTPRGKTPPKGNPAASGGSNGAYTVGSTRNFGSEKTAMIEVTPIVTKQGYGGFEALSVPKSDRARAMRNVIHYEYNTMLWPVWKQGGTADPYGADLLANAIFVYYNKMSARISMEKRLIPQQALAAAVDFTNWLNGYCEAYLALRGLQGALAAGAFNLGTETIASAIMGGGNYNRLQFDLDRLATIPCPPGLRDTMDPLCGSYILGPTSPCYIATFNPSRGAATTDDITTTAGVGAILTSAETNLALAEGVSAESAQILQLMGFLYGVPEPLPEKRVYTDPNYLAFHYCQAAVVRDSTTTTSFVNPTPNLTGQNGQLIVLTAKGAGECPQMFTMFRPDVYQIDNATGSATPSVAGFISLGATNSAAVVGSVSSVGVYSQNVFTATTAAMLASNGSVVGNVDAFWWSLLDANEATGVLSGDTRAYWQWDVHYITPSQLAAMTEARLDEIFLGGMKLARATGSAANVQ